MKEYLIRNIPDNLFKLVAQKSESIIPIVQKYISAPINVKDSNESKRPKLRDGFLQP